MILVTNCNDTAWKQTHDLNFASCKSAALIIISTKNSHVGLIFAYKSLFLNSY